MLQTGGVPAARIRTLEECLSSEQVQKRSFIYTCPDTGLKVPTLPFKFSRDDSPCICAQLRNMVVIHR